MSTEQIHTLLKAERDKLNRAIEALQGSAKRRGRPPKNPLAMVVAGSAPAKEERKPRSAAQHKAQSESMKKYWVARRKQAKAKG